MLECNLSPAGQPCWSPAWRGVGERAEVPPHNRSRGDVVLSSTPAPPAEGRSQERRCEPPAGRSGAPPPHGQGSSAPSSSPLQQQAARSSC